MSTYSCLLNCGEAEVVVCCFIRDAWRSVTAIRRMVLDVGEFEFYQCLRFSRLLAVLCRKTTRV